jgi:serine phosphatase RsbU (regulator of sigma subunit)/Tfp pilus assembly protein PilF
VRKILVIILVIFSFQYSVANTIDSLLFDLNKENIESAVKVDIYKSLAVAYKSNADTAFYYANKALYLSKEINHPEQIINSYLTISNVYEILGEFDNCIEALFDAREIADSIKHDELLGMVYNNLGNAYRNIEDVENSLEFYKRATKLYKKAGNQLELGRIYNNIGLVFVSKKQYEDAVRSYKISIEIVSKYNDKASLGNCYSNLGIVYYYMGEIDKTILYFEKSLAIDRELNNELGIAISLSNIGELYLEDSNFLKAITNFKQSIETAKRVNAQNLLKHNYLIISDAYAKTKNYAKAYRFFQLHTNIKDSLHGIEKSKYALDLEAKFTNSEKEKKILSLEKQQALNELELTEKKQTQYFLIAGVVIVILLLLVFFVRYRSKKKANELLQIYSDEIEAKNLEITDSITYAKRIQEAILPDKEFVKSYLPNSFVFYQPKDIVAGDFYWMEQINDDVFFAVADCTGHGVPGAMMSVVCHNAMDRALREYKLTIPGEILDKTRELVVDQLNKSKKVQQGIVDDIRDGMDIAFCTLNKSTNELSYAGAYNPLWILRTGGTEVLEVKANRQSIGRVDNPEPFKTEKVLLNKGDSIYVFSDGYADQFGGENEKKFKSKPFKQLLLSMNTDSMEVQHEKLKNHFDNWKGALDQIDDVCVVGVRL